MAAVAHVMDRGTGERALELKPVSHVGHGDDGVGDRRAYCSRSTQWVGT